MVDDWGRVETGTLDLNRLQTARTVATAYEPLISAATFDSAVDPQTLQLSVGAGIRAEAGRFDVAWTDKGYYSYHYTEGEAFNYRYDRHPRADVPEKQFHEPPDANHAVASCIEVEAVPVVTLAVLQLWRDTVESGDLDRLQQPNPP